MRCPTLTELPPPPPGKTGWPWTEESPQLPDTMPDGSPWPRVSIVTPSYNQGQFIEETIRSVLLQGYPNLEYFIMDGGSVDNSVEIIKKYEPWLTYWVSARDDGQSDAINRGFARSTGDYLGWLCSDDLFLPQALVTSVVALESSRSEKVGLVYGDWYVIDSHASCLYTRRAIPFNNYYLLRTLDTFPQPGSLVTCAAWESTGPLSNDFHNLMDVEYWARLSVNWSAIHIDKPLAQLRLYDDCKTRKFILRRAHEYRKLASEIQEWAMDGKLPQAVAMKSQAAALLKQGILNIVAENWREGFESIRECILYDPALKTRWVVKLALLTDRIPLIVQSWLGRLVQKRYRGA